MGKTLHQSRFVLPAVPKMRLLLMMGAIIYSYGLFSGFADLNGLVLGFAFPALYIISGALVLRESPNMEQRILRTIKRTAICFGILALVYLGLSLAVEPHYTLSAISRKAFWFDLVVFNVWALPIGQPIWFVQGLLYAYIIIYFIYKFKLLKFDVYIAAFFLIITLFTGEFASIIGFKVLWHTCLGGNFFTRALPYILLGSFMSRKQKFFRSLRGPRYGIICGIGWVLTMAEYLLLKMSGKSIYTNHLIGMGVVAFSIALGTVFVTETELEIEIRSMFLSKLSRFELAIPFFISPPIYYLIKKATTLENEFYQFLGKFSGIVVLLFSLVIFYLYVFLRLAIVQTNSGAGVTKKETGSEKSSK